MTVFLCFCMFSLLRLNLFLDWSVPRAKGRQRTWEVGGEDHRVLLGVTICWAPWEQSQLHSQAWPSEKLTEKVNEYNLLFLFKSRWPSSLLGVGGVGNADGQYTPRMKFLCVSFYYGFDSSTACLCSLVIFDRSFLSFTPNQELGYSVYKRYRPIYVFVWFTALSMRIARSIQVAANSILLFFFLMTE